MKHIRSDTGWDPYRRIWTLKASWHWRPKKGWKLYIRVTGSFPKTPRCLELANVLESLSLVRARNCSRCWATRRPLELSPKEPEFRRSPERRKLSPIPRWLREKDNESAFR